MSMIARHRRSLEFIILAPVLGFTVLAGLVIYVIILDSVEEFASSSIRQRLDWMSNGVYGIADREVDRLNRAGRAVDEKAARIRQVSALIHIEDFARKYDIAVMVFASDKNQVVLLSGLPEDTPVDVIQGEGQTVRKISLPGGGTYFARTVPFEPWQWRITLLEDASAAAALLANARSYYLAAGGGLLAIAVFLIAYLRRAIARPITRIVRRLHEGQAPDYKGIRQFEFLSDSLGHMMGEIARHREHLEELVRARTAELEKAKEEIEAAHALVMEKNLMLEALSSKLAKYLSPQIYASIFSGQQSVEIASKRKKLTVFFSDIVDFTETTELMEPEELTGLINQYLTEMSAIALAYGATIDKSIGDAVMLFFGDPHTKGVKEDARACVRMAVAMQRRLKELQAEWRHRGLERPLQLRIGINTGYCTVGNFGSEERMDYTAIGNEVNLAARLQSHADRGGIVISSTTHSLVKDIAITEDAETISVKGFPKPIHTYRVLDLCDDHAYQNRIIHCDDEGLTLFIDREKLIGNGLTEAIKSLEDAVAQLKK